MDIRNYFPQPLYFLYVKKDISHREIERDNKDVNNDRIGTKNFQLQLA